jgi:hypothetical protein
MTAQTLSEEAEKDLQLVLVWYKEKSIVKYVHHIV